MAGEVTAIVTVHKLKPRTHLFPTDDTLTTGQIIATFDLWPQKPRPHIVCVAVASAVFSVALAHRFPFKMSEKLFVNWKK